MSRNKGSRPADAADGVTTALRRRSFLAVFAGTAFAVVSCRQPSPQGGAGPADRLLIEAISELKLSPDVGEAYLMELSFQGRIPSREELLEQLRLRIFSRRPAADLNRERLVEVLADAIRQDFESGRTVQLDDWYLSMTECQLEAVKHLLGQESYPPSWVSQGFEPREFGRIEAWGPRKTLRGEAFNVQKNGASTIWVKMLGAPSDLVISMGGIDLKTKVSGELTKGDLDAAQVAQMVAKTEWLPVALLSYREHGLQRVGLFRVASPESPDQWADFVEVELREVVDWGPKRARPSVGFNVQPSGDSAFWVRVAEGGPEDIRLYLGEEGLTTTVQPDLITATVSSAGAQALLDQAGSLPLSLVRPSTEQRQLVGTLEVAP